ncbi:MAG TPA: MucB/RseB C-terminal domain-containing protein [Ramlibacter sp.]
MVPALASKRSFTRSLVAVGLGLGFAWVHAQPAPASSAPHDRNVSEWLMRMHDASKLRSYVGTFVVSSIGGGMSSARIWHACEGNVQVERVESLSGAPRSVFRRNDRVVTFYPEAHVVRTETRDSLGIFTNLLKAGDSSIPEFYIARRVGTDRVAGFETDVVQLAPRDSLRFGYRIWSERKSGLVVKLQTVDADGNVLEQSAFSELALDVPVRADKLTQMMGNTSGWHVQNGDVLRTSAEKEGWQLDSPPAGFKPISCYKRPSPAPGGTLQWVFSDGLAAVSLFLEPFDARRHTQEGLFASGATQTMTRRVQDWWLTAVGEVPPSTLRAFAQALERRK